jgi:hypothetical protein
MADKIDGLKFLKSLSDSSKKVAKEQYAKDLTKKKREKQIALKTKEFEEAQKKESETGAEAESRLLKELKETRGKISTSSGDALYPGDFPDPEIQKMQLETVRGNRDAKSSYMDSEDYRSTQVGEPGTPTRIANERMGKIKQDLKTSQSATKTGRSFSQQKRVKDVQEKQKEFAKIFFRPDVDPKKAEYLVQLATKNYITQKYGYGK